MNTITFNVAHKDDGNVYEFTFTVLDTFKDKCPNYLSTSFLELFMVYDLPRYWHCETGPAVTAALNGKKLIGDDFTKMGLPVESEIYALNGKPMTDDEILKIKTNKN